MIGWLSGTLKERNEELLLVDTGGIGYEVAVSATTAALLPLPGSPVELYVHTHVREDGISLFGFHTPFDRELFRLLMTVSGVGAKTAIGILSRLPSDRLLAAIQNRDVSMLQQTPGIGKKTAERLVLELKDKLKGLEKHAGVSGASKAPEPMWNDLISALTNLGYKRPTAESALAMIDLSKFGSFDRILKETLKVLAK